MAESYKKAKEKSGSPYGITDYSAADNNRIMEARRLKRYCANKEDCQNCIFYNPKGYPYNSTCSISEITCPEYWDV